MGIGCNTTFFRTVLGILKLIECILIFVVLMIARFAGSNGSMVDWGNANATFLGIGTCVGYAIIVPSIMLSYLLGSSPSLLEFIINLVGGILFTSTGATIVTLGGISSVLGSFAIILGVVFIGDFCYLCTIRTFTTKGTGQQK